MKSGESDSRLRANCIANNMQEPTILVVDDTPANLSVLVDHLEHHGFLIVVAQDGYEAIQRAQFVRPDLILLDVMMPGINGFETCRQLKQLAQVQDIPVIFMTALTDADDKLKGFDAGGVDYITKPFQIKEVLARINTHLTLHQTRLQLEEKNLQLRQEIQERKQMEELRLHQNKILEIMTHSIPLSDILSHIIQLVETQQPDSKCAILLTDPQEQYLRHMTAPGLPESYVQAVGRIKIEPLSGSNGAAAYAREPVFVQDIEIDPRWEKYRDFVHPYGIKSCWSYPIISEHNKLLGCFARYQTSPGLPDEQENRLSDTAIYLTRIAIERQNTREKIDYMAHHDALTGLPNRTLLEDRLTQAILYAQRYNRQVTVIFIDLDNFKLINDSLGHSLGDELLKAVAKRMQTSVRKSDTVVRLGGDEFIIILFDQPEKTELVVPTLQHLQQEIARPLMLDGHEISVTSSIGVAVYPTDGKDVDTLMMNADAAMYQAKANGRNNIQLYTPDMNMRIQERLAQIEDLRNALIRKEFILWYQPQLDLKQNRIFGVEALIRWQHPQKGLISPVHFIPLAEETGLIVAIGDWALRTACQQNKSWQDAGLPAVTVSVNVSARQFQEKDLVKRVATALQESGLPPEYLELELTESLIMQDVERATTTMQELNNMGVQLSIDDFGTGYSSLSSLKCFPVIRLKIDKSFVQDLSDDNRNTAIARTIISMGHQLNLKVIAEGVETKSQLQFLKENDCDELQGFCFSQPVPAPACEQLLQQGPPVHFSEWPSGMPF